MLDSVQTIKGIKNSMKALEVKKEFEGSYQDMQEIGIEIVEELRRKLI